MGEQIPHRLGSVVQAKGSLQDSAAKLAEIVRDLHRQLAVEVIEEHAMVAPILYIGSRQGIREIRTEGKR
jgi:hypothetical protein